MKYFRLLVGILSIAVFTAFSGGCSKKLPAETLPPETTAPIFESLLDETTETTETVPTETTVLHGPFSTPVVTQRVVDVHGQLSVDRLDIVDAQGEKIVLRGMCMDIASDDCGFINADTVQTLAEDWGCNVIRFRLDYSSYVNSPDDTFNALCSAVDLCQDQGVYVIADFELPGQCGPDRPYQITAEDLFSRLSAIYADSPNIIYEICSNVGTYDSEDENSVSWSGSVRPYAEAVIDAIRENDSDNIIIVGTPVYESATAMASISLIEESNLLYALNDVESIPSSTAIGIPLIRTSITELYTLDLDALEEAGISWCFCGVGPDGSFDDNLLNYSLDTLTDEEKIGGHWPDEFISTEGLALRELILNSVTEAGEDETEPTEPSDTSETTAETAEETTSTSFDESAQG